jgi:hypothetical protein
MWSIYINKIRHDLSFTRQTNVNKHICTIYGKEFLPSLLILPHDILIDHNVMIDVRLYDN